MKSIICVVFLITLCYATEPTQRFQSHLGSTGLTDFLISKLTANDEIPDNETPLKHYFPQLFTTESTIENDSYSNVSITLQSRTTAELDIRTKNVTTKFQFDGDLNGIIDATNKKKGEYESSGFCAELGISTTSKVKNETIPTNISIIGSGKVIFTGRKCDNVFCPKSLRVKAHSEFEVNTTISGIGTENTVTESSASAFVVKYKSKGQNITRIYVTGNQRQTTITKFGKVSKKVVVERYGTETVRVIGLN